MVGSQCTILLLFILTTTFVEMNTDKCESLLISHYCIYSYHETNYPYISLSQKQQMNN